MGGLQKSLSQEAHQSQERPVYSMRKTCMLFSTSRAARRTISLMLQSLVNGAGVADRAMSKLQSNATASMQVINQVLAVKAVVCDAQSSFDLPFSVFCNLSRTAHHVSF